MGDKHVQSRVVAFPEDLCPPEGKGYLMRSTLINSTGSICGHESKISRWRTKEEFDDKIFERTTVAPQAVRLAMTSSMA